MLRKDEKSQCAKTEVFLLSFLEGDMQTNVKDSAVRLHFKFALQTLLLTVLPRNTAEGRKRSMCEN